MSGHYKVNCTAKLIKCKDCYRYHHKLVKCAQSFNDPYFSGDVDWISKSRLNPNDSIILGKSKINNHQNKSCSTKLYFRNMDSNDEITTYTEQLIPDEVLSNSSGSEMGINWDKLKFIPFPKTNNDILLKPNRNDVNNSCALPYTNSHIDWWELEDNNTDSFSDDSLVNSECSSSTEFSDSPFGKGMDSDTDSGVSGTGMVCY